MAPEQLEGARTDGRTDVFAFGAMLFEMATGERAFGGASAALRLPVSSPTRGRTRYSGVRTFHGHSIELSQPASLKIPMTGGSTPPTCCANFSGRPKTRAKAGLWARIGVG